MLNLSSIMIGTSQPKVLVKFYEKVIGKKPDMADDNYTGWVVGKTFISISPHSQVNGMAKEPARIMFNFESKEVKEEYERIKKIGAKVVQELYEIEGMWIATFADPDGNYFQLMTAWEEDK
ncbi:MAG TPA: VOC family protein [Candidatus Dojkabacteria bacterium]|nr:VOC family protein [Candidatus Dojkabacteria bacterium]